MTKLPPSFDPYLIKDELLAALRQSPLTSQLVSLRAEEIIQIIMEKPIVMTLQEQLRSLKHKLEEERVSRRTLRSDSKRQYKDQEREVSQRERLIHTLNQELEAQAQSIQAYELQKQQLQSINAEYQAKIEQLQNENAEYQQQIGQTKSQLDQATRKIGKLQQNIEEKTRTITVMSEQQQKGQLQWKRKEENYQAELLKLRQEVERTIKSHGQQLSVAASQNKLQLEQRDSIIQGLKQQRFNLKNQINGLKIDLQQNNRLTTSLQQQKKELLGQKEKLKETIKVNKIIFDKERKMVNQRLHELSATSKQHQKLKSNIAVLYKSVGKLKGEYQKLTVWVKQQLKVLGIESQDKTKLLLDEVGKHVDMQLKALSQKLQVKNEQVRGARSEAKMREQVLQRSEKQASSYNKEIAELKSELRQKKREQQRLRRELKTNYEQYQAKLSKMEKKYLQLLDKGGF